MSLAMNPDVHANPLICLGLRARVWVSAQHLFLREGAQESCWLWLLLESGRLEVLRLPASQYADDTLLAPLVLSLTYPDEDEQAAHVTLAFLPHAPITPVPRWSVSWGHPLQREIRAFAAHLDAEILNVLGDMEVAGAFLGCVSNYNRLALLAPEIRWRRLQALAEFPALLMPLLLDAPEKPELFQGVQIRGAARAHIPAVLAAIDQGRDLIGALAAYYRIDRALVRAPLCREPWPVGALSRSVLALLHAIPAHERPRTRAEIEPFLPVLLALPLDWDSPFEAAYLARAFKGGWSTVWMDVHTRFGLHTAVWTDTGDFLRAASVAEQRLGFEISAHSLGLAWVARRGLVALLTASSRWHTQPPPVIVPEGLDARVLPAVLGEWQNAAGAAREILTHAELSAEGQTMQHCVADYWQECVRQCTRILHLTLEDGEQATAQFDADDARDDVVFHLEQLRGVANAEVSAAMETLASALQEALNAGEHKQVRLELCAWSANEAARALPGRRPAGHAPLDRASQRELALVVAWWRKQSLNVGIVNEHWRGMVAGFQYHAGSNLIHQLEPGQMLELVREPDNPHDPLAVRMDWQGHKLGYVPRPANAPLAAMLDNKQTLAARITRVRPFAERWQQVAAVVFEGV
ncbi:MAG: HIRAN domain-containing protein [Halothiobacillaceae bacterium]